MTSSSVDEPEKTFSRPWTADHYQVLFRKLLSLACSFTLNCSPGFQYLYKYQQMFEKTLTDVVKGIRASKRDTALYISQCIAEIKSEINSSDMHVKANALQKLTFLQMMGYSMNWASFPSIEVMSSPRFAHKRVGYLAAVSKRQFFGSNCGLSRILTKNRYCI